MLNASLIYDATERWLVKVKQLLKSTLKCKFTYIRCLFKMWNYDSSNYFYSFFDHFRAVFPMYSKCIDILSATQKIKRNNTLDKPLDCLLYWMPWLQTKLVNWLFCILSMELPKVMKSMQKCSRSSWL